MAASAGFPFVGPGKGSQFVYYKWNTEKMWHHKNMKEYLFFSSGHNSLKIIGHLFHKSQKDH